MRYPICAAFLAAACAPVATGPGLALATAETEPAAMVGVTGEARFDVAATRDGVGVPAACTAEGRGFRAAFTAPATVAVPSFGPASGEVRVVCAHDGARGGRVLAPTLQSAGGYGAVVPAIGVGIGTGSGAGVSLGGYWGTWGTQRRDVRYPDVGIALR